METPGHWASGCICLYIGVGRPPTPPLPSAVFGMEKSPAWGYWGFRGTNEKLIRSQGCRERAGWGYTPAPPFPRQNLGLSYLTCPPKRAGAGTDPRTGPTTPYSLLPRPGQDAAGLSRSAPGEQDGGRSSVGTQKGQRPAFSWPTRNSQSLPFKL